jgi:putative membrane protein
MNGQQGTTPTSKGQQTAGQSAPPASGQSRDQKKSTAKDGGQTGSSDRMTADSAFITKAAQGGMAEVRHGQLAADKASNSDVKQFAQQMVDDHSKSNDELKQLASSKGVTLPADIGPKHQAAHDRLSKLSGAEFDRAYMQHMVAEHKATVDEFRRESRNGSDPEVKAWAAKSLPTLERHLRMAETTAGKLK